MVWSRERDKKAKREGGTSAAPDRGRSRGCSTTCASGSSWECKEHSRITDCGHQAGERGRSHSCLPGFPASPPNHSFPLCLALAVFEFSALTPAVFPGLHREAQLPSISHHGVSYPRKAWQPKLPPAPSSALELGQAKPQTLMEFIRERSHGAEQLKETIPS